ncbi:MAG: glycoside hydrolase family 3 C-terminal domain-containing protein [Bacteroidales bacterium]|nr:glycoside hydrolase family 3 C-terminal domain-containing protein [Bacteroidales bacterium]
MRFYNYILGIIAIGLIAILNTSCSNNKTTNIDEKEQHFVDSVVNRLTLKQKIGQLCQFNTLGNINQMINLVKNDEVGSFLNVNDPEQINQLQKAALESPSGIPLIMGRDVIHGYKTVFPIPIGQASSFDTSLVRQACSIAAEEAASDGIRWTFSPMVDIARDPRWGRIAEGYGEDTYLASAMGIAAVKGYQGDNLNNPKSIAACVKHFAGYGAATAGRDYNSTFIPERQLRNVYLPPFKAVVKSGCASVMTSFNDNDGVPSTGNYHILTDILRFEWKFDGFVVTDWNSMSEMINHGFCADSENAALMAVTAGTDMEMCSRCYADNLENLVKKGVINEQLITERVKNIVRIKYRLGLFSNPYVNIPQEVKYSQKNLDVALKMSEESAILLKNEKVLPFGSNVKKILLTGPMADAPYDQLGTWCMDGESSHTITPLKAFQNSSYEVVYIPGIKYCRDKNTSEFQQVINAAKTVDAIVFVGGEESIMSGEAHSLSNIHLQGAQSELISQLSKVNKPLVTVIMAGRSLIIGEELDKSEAMLYWFHPGTMGGTALVNLLSGKAIPSAKTPVTFPKSEGQIPIYYNQNSTGRPASGKEPLLDEIPLNEKQTSLGYTSYYLDSGFGPLIPFGYGLSYTTFSFENLKINSNTFSINDTIEVSFNIKNTGDYDGVSIPQLYIRDLFGSITRPIKELKRFARVAVNKSSSIEYTFKLPVTDLAFCGMYFVDTIEPGKYKLWIAEDSSLQNALEYDFEVVIK